MTKWLAKYEIVKEYLELPEMENHVLRQNTKG